MSEWLDLELWRDGEFLADASGPKEAAEREIAHYAMVYGQDGPVQVMRVVREPYVPSRDRKR